MEHDEDRYLIWSVEHGAWWKPHRHGYTRDFTEAGTYSFQEAKMICYDANAFCNHIPKETMIAYLDYASFKKAASAQQRIKT